MNKPIVSVNNMSMNESVAATCCFRIDNVNGSVYETVLSGGSIELITKNVMQYKEGFCDKSNCWLSIPGDFLPALNGDHLAIKKDIFGNKVYCAVDAGGAILGVLQTSDLTSSAYVGDLVLVTWNETDGQQTYNLITDHSHRYCDHQGTYCDYVDGVTQQITRNHVGATVEHIAGGNNWAAAHTAMRFNS